MSRHETPAPLRVAMCRSRSDRGWRFRRGEWDGFPRRSCERPIRPSSSASIDQDNRRDSPEGTVDPPPREFWITDQSERLSSRMNRVFLGHCTAVSIRNTGTPRAPLPKTLRIAPSVRPWRIRSTACSAESASCTRNPCDSQSSARNRRIVGSWSATSVWKVRPIAGDESSIGRMRSKRALIATCVVRSVVAGASRRYRQPFWERKQAPIRPINGAVRRALSRPSIASVRGNPLMRSPCLESTRVQWWRPTTVSNREIAFGPCCSISK